MAKSQTVRGTPYHFVKSGGAGIAPGRPDGMTHTVKEGYSSDNRGYQPNPRGGTPYQSNAGNPGDASLGGTDRYGKVISENGQDHADPKSNGSGTTFNGATQANGYTVKPDAPTLDSPVPRDAPRFDPGFIQTEDRAHLGSGNEGAADSLVKGGGLMSG